MRAVLATSVDGPLEFVTDHPDPTGDGDAELVAEFFASLTVFTAQAVIEP